MSELRLRPHGKGIYSLDSGFLGEQVDAIHLIVEQSRAAFIDTGAQVSIPRMLSALAELELDVEAVDYVILTHVHLDHAGGAGGLMQKLPKARLIVHPRGARHMIDPSKLWAATVAVYGQKNAEDMYGELIPVDASRVIEAIDGFSLELAGRKFEFHDSPGHAKHHHVIHDRGANVVFTGDTFGLSYRALDVDGRPSIFPSTTPTQFDPEALKASVSMIENLKPSAAYLTHYSEVRDVPRLAADMRRLVDEHASLGRQWVDVADLAERDAGLRSGIQKIIRDEATRSGADPEQWLDVLGNDVILNAQGISAWIDFQDKKPAVT